MSIHNCPGGPRSAADIAIALKHRRRGNEVVLDPPVYLGVASVAEHANIQEERAIRLELSIFSCLRVPDSATAAIRVAGSVGVITRAAVTQKPPDEFLGGAASVSGVGVSA